MKAQAASTPPAPSSNAANRLLAMTLINEAYEAAFDCKDPGKQVKGVQDFLVTQEKEKKDSDPEFKGFWNEAVVKEPVGGNSRGTFSYVNPECVDEFRRLAKQYVEGGYWRWRYRRGSFISCFPEQIFSRRCCEDSFVGTSNWF
jgi:hypothetical protein